MKIEPLVGNSDIQIQADEYREHLKLLKSLRLLKLGDKILFRSSPRFGCKIIWRMITGFVGTSPTVRFRGQDNFVVKLNKIQAVEQ